MTTAKCKLKYWIKERYNPQLGTYFYYCGQLSNTEAMSMETPKTGLFLTALYGSNIMHSYDTKEEADAALTAFQKANLESCKH